MARERGRLTRSRMTAVLVAMIVGAFVCITCGWLAWLDYNERIELYHNDSVPRLDYTYSWTDNDWQGDVTSTVAACDILLRIHGIDVGRERVAESIEQNGGEDATENVALALNYLVDPSHVCVDIQYTMLQWLPGPSVVWTKDDGGHTKAVVFLYADESTVQVADPAEGLVTYGFTEFQKLYDFGNRAAVYICARGYEPEQ